MKVLLVLFVISFVIEKCSRNYISNDLVTKLKYIKGIPNTARTYNEYKYNFK